jgi:hypothetical protein
MNCLKYEELFDKLRDGAIDDEGLGTLKSHIEKCSNCRRKQENLEKIEGFLKESFQSETKAVEARDSILSKLSPTQPVTAREGKRTMFEKLKKPAFAAASIAAVIVVLLLAGVFETSSTAYALTDTILANQGLRFIHIKLEPSTYGSIDEMWAEFDENGELLRMRYHFPDTEDGPKQVVWQGNKAEVWFKKKDAIGVFKAEDMLEKMKLPITFFDPKIIVEKLYQEQEQGKLKIETQMPSTNDGPIKLTALRSDSDTRRVYKVDPQTKLLLESETFEFQNDEYVLTRRIKYLDYNQPVDPGLFAFTPPEDVIRVDFITQEIGLHQGDLTDEEIVVKVVREFFEALIAKDYAKAGQIFSGTPASKMEEYFGAKNFTRIIVIEEPTPHPTPGVGGFRVHCTVEIGTNGATREWKCWPAVRHVPDKPDWWHIHGGV